MPEYISDIINQINYKDNFGYTLPNDCPNPTYTNDMQSNGKYSEYARYHIKQVMRIWFQDTGIEAAEPYQNSPQPDHFYPAQSLRSIAENIFNVDKRILADIDNNIMSHDRSRYVADEFFPTGNIIYSSRVAEQPADAFGLAQAKHFHRNPHHLQHYVIEDRGDTPSAVEMPEMFIWEMIADWIANMNYGYPEAPYRNPQPYVYYWGSKYAKQVKMYTEDRYPMDQTITPTQQSVSVHTVVYHDVYMWYLLENRTPLLPQGIPVGLTTQARIEQIVARWQPLDDGGMDNPDIPFIPGTQTPMSPGYNNAQRISREVIIDNYSSASVPSSSTPGGGA